MGSNMSSSSKMLTAFEIANEIFISVGAGVLGILLLTYRGIENNSFMKSLLVSAITLGSLIYVFQTNQNVTPSLDKVVFITGCDSGLGFSLAHHACEMGFTVIAGCLKLESEGAKKLRSLFGKKIHHVEIDVTRETSVEVALDVIKRFFSLNPQYTLWAVINNAGVMVFGEFEWLTEKLVHKQVNVNLLGTFRVTKGFCPLLRQYGGRIIIISSHCALATLPGLSVYGATKAGLLAWSDGLRVEMAKYGVSIISFIPGSFVTQSNIMAKQKDYNLEMQKHFTTEQSAFYEDYFKRYTSYLNLMDGTKMLAKIPDPAMYAKFERALLEISPKALYINEPLSYSIYHTLFKYSPFIIRDYLVNKFMQMPEYKVQSPSIDVIV